MSLFYRCDVCGAEYEPDNVSNKHKYDLCKRMIWPHISLHMCDECLTKLNDAVDAKFEYDVDSKSACFERLKKELCPEWVQKGKFLDETRTDAILNYVAKVKSERAFYFKTLNWVVPSLLIIIAGLGIKMLF